MRRRVYDFTSIRSLTQEDPIGLAGGLNLYGFAAGDPVNLGDAFGLRPLSGTERRRLGALCDHINCDRVEVLDGRGSLLENAQRSLLTGGGKRSFTWGHTIHLSDQDIASLDAGSQEGMSALAHELTHVVQFEKYGTGEYARRGVNDRVAERAVGVDLTYYNNREGQYRFRFTGKRFWEYNTDGLEYQATIVEECFGGRRVACGVSPYKPR